MLSLNLECILPNVASLIYVLRYMRKGFPLSLLCEKITEQARCLQNINYYARKTNYKQQEDTGFT